MACCGWCATTAKAARKVLGSADDRWTETEVLVMELSNEPGAFAAVAQKLADEHVNITYAYCTGGARGGRTTAVFKLQDRQGCEGAGVHEAQAQGQGQGLSDAKRAAAEVGAAGWESRHAKNWPWLKVAVIERGRVLAWWESRGCCPNRPLDRDDIVVSSWHGGQRMMGKRQTADPSFSPPWLIWGLRRP